MSKNLLCLLLFIGIVFIGQTLAQPELDTTFAGSGKLIMPLPMIGVPSDVITQPDNKIIVTSACAHINYSVVPFCTVRFNPDGTPDSTFGNIQNNPGLVITRNFGLNPDSGSSNGAALQSDGKILVAGDGTFSDINRRRFILIRYNADGSLDTSFGSSGGIVRDLNILDTFAEKVIIQPDGKILIVGYTGTSNYSQIVVRFNSDGTLDNSFGSNGAVTINIAGNSTTGLSIALQSDGKILTGGSMWNSSSGSYLAARLNPNGTLDTTFDGDGLKSIAFSGTGFFSLGFKSLVVQSDGKIVALGHRNILYRMNSDGSLDTSFDGDGSRPALNGISDANDVFVTPSGKITVVGFLTYPSGGLPNEYLVARYLPSGSPDTAFSDDGFLSIDIDSSHLDGADTVTADSQGRIVIAGRTATTGPASSIWENAKTSFARLMATPVQNVAVSGRIFKADGKPVINGFVTIKSGAQVIAVGRTNSFGYYHFQNIQSGQTYTVSVRAKNLFFYDQNVLVDDTITNFLVVGNQ